MSYYTSEVSSKLIDPNVYISNLRVEFQLPKNDYGNRMRLQNIGLTAAGTPQYNTYIGAVSSIKSVRLLNGRDELDSCREVNRFLSWKRFNKSNTLSLGIGQQSYKNKYGLCYSGDGTGADAANAQKKITKPMDLGGAAKLQLTINESTTPKAYLDLKECLPFLNAVEVLPADLFPQLRLVIEYETDVRNMITVDNQTVTTTRPLLAVDVIEDSQLVKNMMSSLNGITWNCIEHDLCRIQESNVNTTQKVVNRLNGFNNKRLMKFHIQKVPTDKRANVNDANGVRDGGDLYSQAFYDELFNVRINGRPKIAGVGAQYPNQRLSLTVDAFGECTTFYGCNRQGVDQPSEVTSNNLNSGCQDYYGLYVNDIIKDFELDISRTTKNNTVGVNFKKPQSAGYDVHVFGEIRKQFVVSGSDYQVKYA